MTNEEINKYIHVEIMGKCVHENASRNKADPILMIDCVDCGRTMTARQFGDENWECRHSEKDPKFQKVRSCKYCGAVDVSFDLGILPRPDYCSSLDAVALVEAKVIEGLSLTVKNPNVIYCRHLMVANGFSFDDLGYLYEQVIRATSLQRATACVKAWEGKDAR